LLVWGYFFENLTSCKFKLPCGSRGKRLWWPKIFRNKSGSTFQVKRKFSAVMCMDWKILLKFMKSKITHWYINLPFSCDVLGSLEGEVDSCSRYHLALQFHTHCCTLFYFISHIWRHASEAKNFTILGYHI